MKKVALTSICLTAILLLTAAFVTAAETIRYNGCSITLVTVIKPLSEAFTQKTGVIFDLKGKDTAFGLEKMIAGECDIVGSGTDKIDKYQQQAGGNLKTFKFAQEGVAIGVNALNPVNDLSSAQLADVMTGRVEEWNAVGWPQGKKIVPISCAKDTAHYENMVKTVLKDAPFSANTIYAQVNPLVPAEIAKYPGAIGYTGLSVFEGKQGIKILSLGGVALSQETVDSGAYPIRKTYFLITKGEPAGKLKEFLDFCLSPEGQEIIAKAGMLKVVK